MGIRERMYPRGEQEVSVMRMHCAHAGYVWNLAAEQQSWWWPGRGHAPWFAEHSSALAVTYAEREMDRAAARLAETADALPLDRKPAGWNEPPAVAGVLAVARTRFVKAALRVLAAEYADESADADAGAEYADGQLALAARNLAADVEAQRTAKAETAGRLL